MDIALVSLIFCDIIPHSNTMLVDVGNSLILSVIKPVEPLPWGNLNLPSRVDLAVERGGFIPSVSPYSIKCIRFCNLRQLLLLLCVYFLRSRGVLGVLK